MNTFLTAGLSVLLCLASLGAQAYELRLQDERDRTRTYQGLLDTFVFEGKEVTQQGKTKYLLVDAVTGTEGDAASVQQTLTLHCNTAGDSGQAAWTDEEKFALTRSPLGMVTPLKLLDSKRKDIVFKKKDVWLDMYGMTLFLPEKDVKEGDTWTAAGESHIYLAPYLLTGKYEYTFELAGTEKVGEAEYLKIGSTFTFECPKQRVNGIEQTRKLTGVATILFNQAAGEIYSVKLGIEHSMTFYPKSNRQKTSTVSINCSGTISLQEQ